MTKAELIDALALKTQSTKIASRKFVQALSEIVTAELCNEGTVDFENVGKLSIKYNHERAGRNPATMEVIKIAPSKGIKFRLSSTLKKALNPPK